MTHPHDPSRSNEAAREGGGASAGDGAAKPGTQGAVRSGHPPIGWASLNPLERLVFRLWPAARKSPRAAVLKKAPSSVLRIATLIQQPYPIERIMERPPMLRRRLERLVRAKPDGRQLAIGYGFEYVKRRLLRSLLPEYRFVFLPFGQSRDMLEPAISASPPFTVFVWSYRDETNGLDTRFWRDSPTVRVEDGFIRSVGLGSDGALPYSWCVDRSGLYFDASAPSDLETIANSFDFASEPALLERADALIARICRTGISKYNLGGTPGPGVGRNGEPSREGKRILVIGQVEDDQSILRNRSAVATNEDLLKRAIADNPGADIVFRPHPDVASGNRKALSDPERLLPAWRRAPQGQSLSDALDACDELYTISSLSGFEALLRGKQVKTFGGPFYAGWGLTDDAMRFPRRTRTLSLSELFAAAYILYPLYFDPRTGKRLDIEAVLARLEADRLP